MIRSWEMHTVLASVGRDQILGEMTWVLSGRGPAKTALVNGEGPIRTGTEKLVCGNDSSQNEEMRKGMGRLLTATNGISRLDEVTQGRKNKVKVAHHRKAEKTLQVHPNGTGRGRLSVARIACVTPGKGEAHSVSSSERQLTTVAVPALFIRHICKSQLVQTGQVDFF